MLGNFSISEISMGPMGPNSGSLHLTKPNAKMEGLYTLTVRTKTNLTWPEFGNETLSRYRTHVRAFSKTLVAFLLVSRSLGSWSYLTTF